MKAIKQCALLALTATLLSSGVALADRGHGHGGGHWRGNVGIYVGPGFGPYYPRPYYAPYYGDPYYYGYPPAYYPAPIVVTPAQPPVYIERAPQVQEQAQETPSPSAPAQDYFWYHCDKPEGYYPYIKECPQGWQKVTPEPPKAQ